MSLSLEYLDNDVLTASPHRLHLLVVDGVIRFAGQGKLALEQGRWEDLDRALMRARSCLTELSGGVNDAHAPQLAEQVRTLFLFIYRSLVVAELERNPGRIDDAIRLLKIHRETWVELGLKLQAGQAAAGPAPSSRVPEPHLQTSRSWVT